MSESKNMKHQDLNLQFVDNFTSALDADPITDNTKRQVHEAAYSWVSPTPSALPSILAVSPDVAALIGLDYNLKTDNFFRDVFTGNTSFASANPYAMCYGGHQFGHWAGQLGDGRAINIAEVAHNDLRWVLQLKGAGPTPYSRTADGLAVLRSSIREYLCSEAMHFLGVPSTRALSIGLTGDEVLRDVMYDGHPAYEKGAVVCRVAQSFIRFGSFEIFASRKDISNLKKLADYTITTHYPEIKAEGKQKYVAFFQAVAKRTLEMVLQWQRVGFVHGVMNTDNMSILGQTIDYGPYGWLEGYDHNWTPNTTDRAHRRYRYGYQPRICLWNLMQLANALYPLIEENEPLESILENYQGQYPVEELKMIRAKMGFLQAYDEDKHIIEQWKKVIHLTEVDFTIFFRELSGLDAEDLDDSKGLPTQLLDAFYNSEHYNGDIKIQWDDWWSGYINRLSKETDPIQSRQKVMKLVNPKYVLRNYLAQLCIDKADNQDYSMLHELAVMLRSPYTDNPKYDKWYAKRPEWARNKVGCSMLSCSS